MNEDESHRIIYMLSCVSFHAFQTESEYLYICPEKRLPADRKRNSIIIVGHSHSLLSLFILFLLPNVSVMLVKRNHQVSEKVTNTCF